MCFPRAFCGCCLQTSRLRWHPSEGSVQTALRLPFSQACHSLRHYSQHAYLQLAPSSERFSFSWVTKLEDRHDLYKSSVIGPLDLQRRRGSVLSENLHKWSPLLSLAARRLAPPSGVPPRRYSHADIDLWPSLMQTPFVRYALASPRNHFGNHFLARSDALSV